MLHGEYMGITAYYLLTTSIIMCWHAKFYAGIHDMFSQ